jgi:hypothetical protein
MGVPQRMTALVVHAEEPLDNRMGHGDNSLRSVRILIEREPAPIYATRDFKLDRDHWLVRGQEVPVMIDPDDPGQFEPVWEEVPDIERRAAENDPTLADPVGTRKRVMERLRESGALDAEPQGFTQRVGQMADRARATADLLGAEGGLEDHFQESLDQAAASEAPAGKSRGVVVIAATTATLKQEHTGSEHTVHWYADAHGKHEAVLSVTIPGQAPYAAYLKKFDHKSGKAVDQGAGLPALVSTSDPNDVEVQWGEMLSVKEHDRQTAARAMEETSKHAAALSEGLSRAAEGNPMTPPEGIGPGTQPNIPQLTPEMKEMMKANAKASLAAVPPAMRQMMIQQFKAAGIELDESDLA